MIWACPVCHESLVPSDRQLSCINNHRFDQAKQGYVNLLLANQKNSKDPGDGREMMLNRRVFLNQGFYEPLAALLTARLEERAADESNTLNVLDSGCGEGYYLHHLQSTCTERFNAYGLDISKEAAKLAARTYPECQWVVASGFKLPVQNDSIDILLRVFAPGDDAEVSRVLASGGQFWRVSPGADHLKELKAELYDQQQSHGDPASPEGFQLVANERLSYTFTLDSQEMIQTLLAMTPFVWQASEQKQAQIKELPSLSVTADFIVQRWSPC